MDCLPSRVARHCAGAERPFNTNGSRLAEHDLNGIFVRQRCLDHLFLHLAVQRDEQFLMHVVNAQIDQRILLGKLGQRCVERAAVGVPLRNDDRFQGRRGEIALLHARARFADRIADTNIAEFPDLADSPGADEPTPNG